MVEVEETTAVGTEVDVEHQWDTHETGGTYWGRTIALLFLHCIPVFGFGMAFTEMGYGATCFKALAEVHESSSYVLMGAGIFAAVLYIYDVGYWHGCCAAFRPVLLAVLFGGCGAAAVLSFQTHPYLPLGVTLLFIPLYYAAIRELFYGHCHIANYISSVGMVNIVGGTGCLVASIIWASHHNFWWGLETQLVFKSALLVDEDPTNSACLARCQIDELQMADACNSTACVQAWTNPECLEFAGERDAAGTGWRQAPRYNGLKCQTLACQAELAKDSSFKCLPALLLYMSQFIAAIATMIFGFVAVLLARSMRYQARRGVEQMNPVVKIFSLCFFISLMIAWSAASLHGASLRLSNLVMAMALVLMVVSVMMIGATVGWKALKEDVNKIPLVSSLDNLKHSTMVKSIMILFTGPLIPLYFGISFINQVGRRCLPFTKELRNEESTDFDERFIWLTSVGRQQWDEIKAWPWTAVLRGMVIFSGVYFGLQVGAGKVVVMFLSWLNGVLEGTALGAVTAIYVGVGLCMFLLPPVPGVPVYLTGGIIVTKAAEASFRPADDPCNDPSDPCNGGMSADETYFWYATGYACLCAFVTKLLAIAMQQKCIGGALGNKVAIRSLVSVNSSTIRSIKLLLSDPRPLTVAKVCILVGGPDWPTSVLTGVLGIRLLPMLIGSIPVIFPISLTTAAGAMLLKSSDESYQTISGFTLTLAASAQLLSAVAAGMVIETCTKTRAAEIAPSPENPLDEEVKAHEDAAEEHKKLAAKATAWKRVPWLVRIVLLLAALSAQVATILFMGFGDRCLEPVEVTTDLSLPPFNDNPLKVVKDPVGWIALIAQLAALVLLWVYGQWATHATNLEKARQEELKEDDTSEKVDMIAKP